MVKSEVGRSSRNTSRWWKNFRVAIDQCRTSLVKQDLHGKRGVAMEGTDDLTQQGVDKTFSVAQVLVASRSSDGVRSRTRTRRRTRGGCGGHSGERTHACGKGGGVVLGSGGGGGGVRLQAKSAPACGERTDGIKWQQMRDNANTPKTAQQHKEARSTTVHHDGKRVDRQYCLLTPVGSRPNTGQCLYSHCRTLHRI
jgi:hypothetical protein